MEKITFFDLEVSLENQTISDIGAVRSDNGELHTGVRSKFMDFIKDSKYLCGHNIFSFDLKYIGEDLKHLAAVPVFIDTLPWSPLMFPTRPYHHLVKDDKLSSEEMNNPVNDAKKARDLFYDEVNAFLALPEEMRRIFYGLLKDKDEYSGFLGYVQQTETGSLPEDIQNYFTGKICENANLNEMIYSHPIELAYSLALINTNDKSSIIPPWVTKKYPHTYDVINELRNKPCKCGCNYCNGLLNIQDQLKNYFGFDEFRIYNGKPLQREAVQAAVDGKSLLAVFQTGGGKSLTFQLPALIAGETGRGLTVVISPLQSLMKDQVDNLEARGIAEAVTINGLLSPIERKKALDRLANGLCSILYISPESLRSNTIEHLLLSRNVVRFVIDEAHCFSSWGQDFRVDYLYIGEFIRKLQNKRGTATPIAVSCFTATAKRKVIEDIRDYFREELNLELELFTTSTARGNLNYEVKFEENESDKYAEVRRLLQAKQCPTIIYVSRTATARELAQRLSKDGYLALPYYGKMERAEKVRNQESFMQGKAEGGVDIIVATSAFGMGVDKDNVGLIIHYDISDSLENYMQEAGRAGRNPEINAECYILFRNEDLDKHFTLLSQTKLSLSDIQQVWKAIKSFSQNTPGFTKSALEIATEAGWENAPDNETRVKAAVAALETAGLIKRKNNVPHVYSTGILADSVIEADAKIDASGIFTGDEKADAKRVIKNLIAKNRRSMAGNDPGESRVDYIADRVGLKLETVVDLVNKLREANILADSEDMTAHFTSSERIEKMQKRMANASRVEDYLLENFPRNGIILYKEMNYKAILDGVDVSTISLIKSILVYWQKIEVAEMTRMLSGSGIELKKRVDPYTQREKFTRRMEIAEFITDYLYSKQPREAKTRHSDVPFSVYELTEEFNKRPKGLLDDNFTATSGDIKEALYYLNFLRVLDLDGGFLVSYNALQIERTGKNSNYRKYKKDDYKNLDDYYAQRIQQIHIVGKYANLLHDNYEEALQYVEDYFTMDYSLFIKKYFKGDEKGKIRWNITSQKYNKLFGDLSPGQREIINDDKSSSIVVAAGPGSGKTRVLVHKLASLLLMENVRADQLLMLTFSRSAATEFKSRLIDLIGEAAYYVDVKTFHSYSFDLLGRLGTLEEAGDIIEKATAFIQSADVDASKITKTVLVIDEAQDMDSKEFRLVRALLKKNDNLKVIAVGDDDQNIFEFRGADSRYMRFFCCGKDEKKYELVTNYRSDRAIVSLSNIFLRTIHSRLKTLPIESSSKEQGLVTIAKYKTKFMDEPVAERIKESYKGGSCCVLTTTNEDALRLTGVLNSKGIRARLIQSNDGFNLYNLREIRDFIRFLENKAASPVVSEENWEEAISLLKTQYKDSNCLSVCLNLTGQFLKTVNKIYISDFIEFVKESSYEDFTGYDRNEVLVSTIHKSKGREFDTVYILLNNYIMQSDEERRAVYVGMTRAKKELHLNYNNDILDCFMAIPGMKTYRDCTDYAEPKELRMQLSYRDVYLDFFKRKQKEISKLQSGTSLTIDGIHLKTGNENCAEDVLQFSQSMIKKLEQLKANGFTIYKAEVRFIVSWKGETSDREYFIVLPELYLKKDNGKQVLQ